MITTSADPIAPKLVESNFRKELSHFIFSAHLKTGLVDRVERNIQNFIQLQHQAFTWVYLDILNTLKQNRHAK